MEGARAKLRWWFRFTGMFPIGVLLVLHLWTSTAVLTSRSAYDAQLVAVNGVPFLWILELGLVFLPLLFHGLFGIHLALRPDPGPHHYASDRAHLLQRVTGMLALVFVGAHLWELRLQGFRGALGASTYSTRLEQHLSSTVWGIPLVALGYVTGIGVCVFHLANGMTSYWSRSGRATTPAELRRARAVFGALGGIFFLASFLVVMQLATGTRLLPAPDLGKSEPCGSPSAAAPGSVAH